MKQPKTLPIAEAAPRGIGFEDRLDDATPHRKRATKKRYALKFEYTGDRSKMNRLQLMLTKGMTRRYETLDAMMDALESWQRGRGHLGSMCKPPLWKASII